MAAASSYLQSVLDVFLSHDIGEIQIDRRILMKNLGNLSALRLSQSETPQQADNLPRVSADKTFTGQVGGIVDQYGS